jgi:hypothetical protein
MHFRISICLPPEFVPARALVWRSQPGGGLVTVDRQISRGIAERAHAAVLDPASRFGWKCYADCGKYEELARRPLRVSGRNAVLETARVSGGMPGFRRASTALLRVEVAPDRWLVVRAIHDDSTAFSRLLSALRTVQVEHSTVSERR